MTKDLTLLSMIQLKVSDVDKEKSHISQEIKWMLSILKWRLYKEFDDFGEENYEVEIPPLEGESSYYSNLVIYYDLTPVQRLILALAMAPIFAPLELCKIVNESDTYLGVALGANLDNHLEMFYPKPSTLLFMLHGLGMEGREQTLAEIINHPLFLLNHLTITANAGAISDGNLRIEHDLINYLAGKIKIDQLNVIPLV